LFSLAFPLSIAQKGRPPVTGRLPELCRILKPWKPGGGDALRKEKALLHTFVAEQKYGVRQYELPILILNESFLQ